MKKQIFLALIVAALSGAVTGVIDAKIEGQKKVQTPQERFCAAIMPSITTIISEAWNLEELCNTSSYAVTTNADSVKIKRIPAANEITSQAAADALNSGITDTTDAVCTLCDNGTNQPEGLKKEFGETTAPNGEIQQDRNTLYLTPVFLQGRLDPFADSDED